MTLNEYYKKIGGNYSEVISRLVKETRISTYLSQFAAEDMLTGFLEHLDDQNYREAFNAIHNIKGLALNLSLIPLIGISAELCEELRNGEPTRDISDKVEELKKVYAAVTEDISLLEQ